MHKVLSFDTLKYANRLKQINVPPEQAELQAEVMKEVLETAFQTAELATKSDITLVRKDMEAMEQRLDAKIEAGNEKLDAKIDSGYAKLDAKIDTSYAKLDSKIDASNEKLDAKIDALYNKLIIRMTSIAVATIGVMGAVMALIQKFVH